VRLTVGNVSKLSTSANAFDRKGQEEPSALTARDRTARCALRDALEKGVVCLLLNSSAGRPKLLVLVVQRRGTTSAFPDWPLARRKRAERALTSVVATCYLLGVSTRGMERLVESFSVTSLSNSQASVMAADLDEQVEAFRTRPLDAAP
jgi:mutator family transposase